MYEAPTNTPQAPILEPPRLLDEILSTEGTGGIYDLCIDLTTEFEKIHEDRVWDGDWLDAVIEFVHEKIS